MRLRDVPDSAFIAAAIAVVAGAGWLGVKTVKWAGAKVKAHNAATVKTREEWARRTKGDVR